MHRLVSHVRIAIGALALALGLCTACYTPSVPLPPPLVEQMSFTVSTTPGTVTLSSPPAAQFGSLRFSVFNVSQGMGVIFISNPDGSFTSPPFPGNDGDYIDISYDTNNESADRCTTLHVGVSPVGSDCL
ncbi:MAG TPA: hypothetical protein VGL86_22095 [Polyangia bacterium]|jgi:hypothetical protein